MTITLRDYQDAMVAEIRDAFRRHRRVLAVAPTGSGKTRTFAYIVNGASQRSKSVMIMAHRQEIVTQISEALDDVGVPHGRIQPGYRPRTSPVQVAMVQTLARRLAEYPAPDLLVIDEAHHATSAGYLAIIAAWPTTRILGVTATPRRLDGKGLGKVFEAMIMGPEMSDLITRGFLAPYSYLAPPQVADLSAVKTRMGDYASDALSMAMDKQTITGDAVAHYRTYLDGRPAIVFCCSVAHSEHVAEQFAKAGYRAASVDGAMDRNERRRRINGIGNGNLQLLTSCDLISEGVDVPVVAGAVLLRPTKSLGLHLQQVGRCLRPKPDGSEAVILDHVGNALRHGLPDLRRTWTLDDRKKREADPPVAQCDVCYRVFDAAGSWRATAECDRDPQPEDCILLAEPAAPTGIQQVDGELEILTSSPPWANGCQITLARGQEWKTLLELADTPEKLKQIARIRGYNIRWVYHILGARNQRVPA